MIKKILLFLLISNFSLQAFAEEKELNNTTEKSLETTGSNPFSQTKFIPDISLILDSSYIYRDLKIDDFNNTRTINGFGSLERYINSKNNINLNYGELAFTATVDPFFDLSTYFHLSEFGFEIEEAYATTRSLPAGFQIKAGKFLSEFGRINSKHAHSWNFNDQSLIYSALLSEHGLLEKGLQINYLAPFNFYFLMGSEIFAGENEKSFGTKGFTIGTNKLEEVNIPNLYTGYLKTSFDLDNLTILGGLSYAGGGIRATEEKEAASTGHTHNHGATSTEAASEGFAGGTNLFGVDLTARYDINSYSYLSLQNEILKRYISGSKYMANDRIASNKEQSGLYSELVYKISNEWKLGLRYDLIFQNDVYENKNKIETNNNLSRYSAMLEYNTSEFARFRLQYNHDRAGYLENKLQPVNEIMLNMNIVIGSHSAHAF